MIFGAPINVVATSFGPTSTPSKPSAPASGCDPLWTRQKGQLLSDVTQGIFKIQQALDVGAPPNAALAMNLADQSRRLGRVMGQLDACGTSSPYTLTQLKTQRAANYNDLVLMELRLNEFWIDHQYTKWLAVRSQVQNYHRLVAKLDMWIARAKTTVAPTTPVVAINEQAPVSTTTTPVDPVAVVDAYPPVVPLYKQSKFWIGVGLFTGVGLGLFALSRA